MDNASEPSNIRLLAQLLHDMKGGNMGRWFGQSWQTTICGICAVIIAVAAAVKNTLDGDPATVADWNEVALAIGLILAGLGLIRAMDAPGK